MRRHTGHQMQAMTEEVFRLIAAGELEQLHGLMHPQAREQLSGELIAETWAAVLAEVGALESLQETRAETPDGDVLIPEEGVSGSLIGQTTLRCEAGEYLGRVACDEQLRVVGLLILEPGLGPLPF